MVHRKDLDFIKGCLIFCVVWGHFCAFYLDNSNYDKTVLTCYTTLFQMPLFLFISGFFSKNKNSTLNFYKQTRNLLVRNGGPFISYCLLAILIVLLKRVVKDGNAYISLYDIRSILSVYWYFICLIICRFLNTLVELSGKWKVVTILLILLVLLTIPSHLYYIPFLWPFFMMGTIYRKYESSIDAFIAGPIGKVIIISMALIFLIGGFIFPRANTFYEMANMIYENTSIILYRYLLYFSATICMLYTFKYIYTLFYNRAIVVIFEKIGQHTLTIFAGHLLIMYYVLAPFSISIMQGSCFAYYCFAPLVTYVLLQFFCAIDMLISRNLFIRHLFLGK